jgi:uncharacterized membrane protein YjdF
MVVGAARGPGTAGVQWTSMEMITPPSIGMMCPLREWTGEAMTSTAITQQRLHRRLTLAIQVILAFGVGAELWAGQWFAALVTTGIIVLTLFPIVLARRYEVHVPPEFSLLAVVFVFASLFLGDLHGYYTRFWWWDAALHTASGFLLGIVGFLLVHILNETAEIGMKMKSGFVAFFAFLFAVGVGVVWEIFEFASDELLGTTMQKPLGDDASGLTDTMWDLIVDTLGALTISILGYGYLKKAGNESFLIRWIQSFVRHNPRLFNDS